MKTKIVVLIMFLLSTQGAWAQIMFQRQYGGTDNETGNNVLQTSDGGYIVTGSTESFGAGTRDVYLIKTDEFGDTLWTKTIGGSGDDQSTSIKATNNNGYVIVGRTSSFGAGSIDVFCIKTDQNGDTIWTRTYGGTDADDGSEIIQTNDNCYLLIGSTSSYGEGFSSVYCVKININGDTLWSKTYSKKNSNLGSSIIQTADNGYLIVATTSINGVPNSKDGLIIKINSIGDTIWSKTIGSTGDDWAFNAIGLSNGNYLITGVSNSYGAGGYDIFLSQLDNNGGEVWTRTYGGLDDEWGGGLQQTSDSGYILAGSTYSFGLANEDIFLIKTDQNGDTIWTKTFGGVGDDWGSSVKQTADNGFIISGYTNSFGNGYEVFLVKTNPDGISGLPQIIQQNIQYEVYPNPGNGQFSIEFEDPNSTAVNVEVFDHAGKLVFEKKGINRQGNVYPLSLAGFPSGSYLLQVNTSKGCAVTKLVIQK